MSGNQESELAAALVTREWAADSVATTPRTARGVGHPLFGFINKKQEEGSSYFGKDGPPVRLVGEWNAGRRSRVPHPFPF
jgi:hypothetical protein